MTTRSYGEAKKAGELIGVAWSTLRESFVAIIVRAGTVFSDQSP